MAKRLQNLARSYGRTDRANKTSGNASADGTRHPIIGSCSVGRAAANTIVLESPKVSRRHAIHLQNIGELWLSILGPATILFLATGDSSPHSTQGRRSNHNRRSGFRVPAADCHFRGVQNGRDATNVPGDRRYFLLASYHRPSRVHSSQPAKRTPPSRASGVESCTVSSSLPIPACNRQNMQPPPPPNVSSSAAPQVGQVRICCEGVAFV